MQSSLPRRSVINISSCCLLATKQYGTGQLTLWGWETQSVLLRAVAPSRLHKTCLHVSAPADHSFKIAIIPYSSPDRLGTRCHTIVIVFLGPLPELLKHRDHALPNSIFPLLSWHLVPISCSLNTCQMLNGWFSCG